MATLDLNPPGDNAHGDELSPLGVRPQMEVQNSQAGDAAWLAAQAHSMQEPTRTGVPYDDMNHGGQPTVGGKPGYDQMKHSGQG